MMGTDGISVADALALRNSGGNGGFGDGDNAWWVIILILVFGMNGWNRGNGNGNSDAPSAYSAFSPCCTPATTQGMTDAFNFNQLDNGIRAIQNGICDGFYATANTINGVNSNLQNCCCETQLGMERGFNGVGQSINNLGYQIQNGFCGVDKTIMQNDFHSQAGFNALSTQLASCCCDIERGQDSIQNALTMATNNILVANDKNTDRIINYLTQTEIDALRTELQSAQFQLSQLSQTSNIVNQLMPVAKPAYLTCSPYASAFGFNTGYGCTSCNSGCGCA